jgi:taurine--2-oxoglutarate transaminase
MLRRFPGAPVPNADLRRRRPPPEEAAYALSALEDEIARRGADHVAAVVLEPVTGASAAAVVPPDGYLQGVRDLCDRHEILLVCDETITAFGRTGRWFASDHWGLRPDVVTYAKGVTSGIVPFSGVLVSGAMAEVFEASPSGFPWGHTFSGYPLGCAVAAETVRILHDEGLVDEAARKGTRLRAQLDELAAGSRLVGETRGLGLLQGLELVDDRESLRALTGGAARLAQLCRDRGLMVYACPTPIGATTLEAVMLAPPLTISDEELDEVVAILADALEALAS